MKNLLFISLLTLLTLMSCERKATVDSTANADAYACPMKCEGEKVYPVAGKCPVCGMALVPVSVSDSTGEFSMNLSTAPEDPVAGQATKLIFLPRKSDNDTLQVPLDEVHEEKIHVILLSKDLGWYEHIHPEYQADGTYTIEQTFPYGGEYIVFADYQPTGAGNQVERKTILVSGLVKPKETFTAESLTTETEGYTVTLKSQNGKFLTNNMNHIGVEVTEDGMPVTNFESVMGAKGHLVIISGDGQKYLHVHPDEVEGKLDLHVQFDQPGIYRAYFQFQTNGKLHTSYFTLDVKEGQPGESGDHDHDHGESDHKHN